MSPAVEDFLSPSSSSTQRTYFQNPNPSVQKYPTDSGMFDDGFNLMKSSKLDCSNDVAAAAAAAPVRSSRRKHVKKVKKQSSYSDAASTKPVNGTGSSTNGFVFNATTSGSVLNSSLGQTGSGGSGEQQSAGEFLDFNILRFSMGVTDNSKLAKSMDSEEAQNNGNKFQDGNLKFVFGADEKVDTRKVGERGANKFGKLNGVDFVFGANMNNGVMNLNSSNVGPDETVGRSGIDGSMKVNNDTAKADSHLVNSMSGLNLGTRGPGEVRPFMDDNPKAEEKNTSDSKKFENVNFVFSANHRDFGTDSNFQKESSFKGNRKINDEMENLKGEGTGSRDYLRKLDNNIDSFIGSNIGFVFGSNLGNAFGDNPLFKVSGEMKTSNIHDPSKVNTMDNINDPVGDSCSCSNNLFASGIDKRDTSCGRSDTTFLNQGRGVNLAGFCSGNAAKTTDEVNKVPAFEEKGKTNIFTKEYSFNKPEVAAGYDGGVPNEPVNQNEKSSDGGNCYSNQLRTEAEFIKGTVPSSSSSSSSTTGLGFVPKVHYSEAPVTSGAGITNSVASEIGGFGISFTGFKTPDINVASSFTSDMFPGLGMKLEFSKSNSVGQRKLKKTKGKPRQQARNYQQGGCTRLSKDIPESCEESPGCSSPMDFSPYSATDGAPASTDPPTSQVKNEDAVDTTEKLGVKKNSSSTANVDAPVRQRPHQKKYKMKTGCGLEFTTPNSRVDASLAHEPTSREHTKATDQETCDKWRKRGNQAYKNGELSEAEICYSKGISSIQHTEIPGFCIEPLLLCYSNRAAARMALGRMREGLKDCRMAASLDPKFVKADLRSANCHLLLGEVEDAIYNYNKCLESGDNVCLDRRIAIEAADGLQKAQKVADYLKLSAELLEQKTYDSATNALRIIADALSISCYSEKLLHMKGEALLVLGKHEEVVQLCEQTLGLAEKNFATGGVVGHMNVDGNDCKNSLKLWRWSLMSKSYFHLGKLEIALDLIEKHAQLRPTTDKIVGPEESLISLAVTIRELLHCKNAGNEAFQSSKHAEAVEHYTAAISKSIESRSFAAVCFCNRAAAYQSLGGIVDAIGDCSIAIALDGSYPKALSRRATLQEMIRDYKHAADDLQRLISILEIQSGKNSQKSATPGSATGGSVKDLRRARRRLSSIEEKAKKERSLDLYLILGIKPSDAASEVKKAYRKAALRHHPDKAGQILARADSGSDGQQWKVIAESIQMDADRLFKMIGEAYAVLSDSTKRSKYDIEEEMWEEMNINVSSSSSSRRASDFYNSPYETTNRRSSQESRKTYTNSHYYYWQDPKKTYHSSYPRW